MNKIDAPSLAGYPPFRLTDPIQVYTPPAPPSTYVPVEPTPTYVPVTTYEGPITVPTPIAQTCPTPGTYTFPATTVVVTETTTVCGASTTLVPSGTHTLGGVTTVVETATTIVCPYATTKTEGNVVTSVIETTTYVCPTPGTYTIAPITTVVTVEETAVVVPVVTSYSPGTYTAAAVVTTITETNVVIYCPFTSPTPVPVAPTETYAVQKPSKTKSKSVTKPTQPPKLGSGGDQWAITYTPYTEGGECKSAGAVMQDIRKIKNAGFSTVRVYSTDCDTLPNVGAACRAAGVKMIIGVFIGEVGCDNGSPDVAEQVAAIKSWAQWDLVELLVVGNEALFNGFCTVPQLAQLITHVKSELGSVGYRGPCTTTDVVSAWVGMNVQPICALIDVVGTNAHAYFNDHTLPQAAGEFVAGQLKIVEQVCGKEGYVMESGWPSAGNCIGKACAGYQQQAAAITSIKKAVGHKVVFFSFGDDHWKKPGDCQCEQHWGCGQLFGA